MSELATMVRGVMAVDPSAPAIEFEERWWSWGEIAEVVRNLEDLLDGARLGPGARVGAMLSNHVLNAALLIALSVSDRCVVTLNPSLPDDRVSADIASLKAPVLVGLAGDWARPAVRKVAAEIGCLGILLSDDPAHPVQLVGGLEKIVGADLRTDAPGIAIEMLTSGTTGKPKRIPLKASAFSRAIIDAGVYDGRKPGDPPKLRGGVQVLNTPFAHIGGVFGLFNCLAAGRRSCLLPRFTVDGWVDAVRRHRPKVAGAPPSALRMILDANVSKEDLSSLAVFRAGTAPLDPDLADEFFERYGIPVLQNYGATEFAGGVAGWTLDDHKAHYAAKRGSVGRLNPGVEARVVDPDSGEPVPFGGEGLLELRASQLGDGKSWMRTTDIAVMDADNFLWIKGRFDNAIIRGGFKVFPDEIVRALEQHPAVREAAVVALPDARLGQVPAAAYLVRSGHAKPTDDDIVEFLRTRLLAYQIPVKFLCLMELPRTPSMKVSALDLMRKFEEADNGVASDTSA